MREVATLRRGKIGFWYRLAICSLKPLLVLFTRREWRGREHIPRSGPVIVAANHISYADPLTLAHFVYECRRLPRYLAKIEVFRMRLAGRVVRGAEQIPVYRNTANAALALRDAVAALERGECVVIYPEGTVTKEPGFWPMQGKTGVARLALMTGAPVVPVAQWGAQELFDRHHKLHLLPRKRIRVLAGAPVDLSEFEGKELTGDVLRAATDAVMRPIREMLGELRREPVPAEVFVYRHPGAAGDEQRRSA